MTGYIEGLRYARRIATKERGPALRKEAESYLDGSRFETARVIEREASDGSLLKDCSLVKPRLYPVPGCAPFGRFAHNQSGERMTSWPCGQRSWVKIEETKAWSSEDLLWEPLKEGA